MIIQGSMYVSVLQESENIVPSDKRRVSEGWYVNWALERVC